MNAFLCLPTGSFFIWGLYTLGHFLLLHKYFCLLPTFMFISFRCFLLKKKSGGHTHVWFLGVLLHYDKVYVLFVSLWGLLALRKLFYIMDQLGLSDFPQGETINTLRQNKWLSLWISSKALQILTRKTLVPYLREATILFIIF